MTLLNSPSGLHLPRAATIVGTLAIAHGIMLTPGELTPDERHHTYKSSTNRRYK